MIAEMLELMKSKFDGGWVSHSVNMVDAYFDRARYEPTDPPPCDQCLVLPYVVLLLLLLLSSSSSSPVYGRWHGAACMAFIDSFS